MAANHAEIHILLNTGLPWRSRHDQSVVLHMLLEDKIKEKAVLWRFHSGVGQCRGSCVSCVVSLFWRRSASNLTWMGAGRGA